MRTAKAGSQVVDSENVRNYGEPQLDGLSTPRGNSEGKPASYDTNYDTMRTSEGSERDVSYGKYWSGREDLNLRPPGPKPGQVVYGNLLNLNGNK